MSFDDEATRLNISFNNTFNTIVQEHRLEINKLEIVIKQFHEEHERLHAIRVQICNALFISDQSSWTFIRDEITKEKLIEPIVDSPPRPSSDVATRLNELLNANCILDKKIDLLIQIQRLHLDMEIKGYEGQRLTEADDMLRKLEKLHG